MYITQCTVQVTDGRCAIRWNQGVNISDNIFIGNGFLLSDKTTAPFSGQANFPTQVNLVSSDKTRREYDSIGDATHCLLLRIGLLVFFFWADEARKTTTSATQLKTCSSKLRHRLCAIFKPEDEHWNCESSISVRWYQDRASYLFLAARREAKPILRPDQDAAIFCSEYTTALRLD